MGRRARNLKNYFGRILWTVDVFANAVVPGARKAETISSRFGRSVRRERRGGRKVRWYKRPFIKFLDMVDRKHAEKSINWSVDLLIQCEETEGLKAKIEALVTREVGRPWPTPKP